MLGEATELLRREREPNFEGRFSTVMSDRFDVPRNFSQVPGILPEVESENPRELRPTTSLVEN